MGSAHPLVEVNVSFNFEGSPSISKGVSGHELETGGHTDWPTGQSESSIVHPTFCGGGIMKETLKYYCTSTINNILYYYKNEMQTFLMHSKGTCFKKSDLQEQ